jgi:peroxiredoxin Q/BCP
MQSQRDAEPRQAAQSVGVGDLAPDFALPSATGETVHLGDFLGKKEVVLYFYPKDNTSGCTAEACSFRDNYDAISDMDAEVLGISSDSQASHQGFATQHRLPFPLLSDEGGAVRKRYGVPATLGLLPGRVTYVIDRQGVIRHVFNSQLNIERHVAEALASLRTLNDGA